MTPKIDRNITTTTLKHRNYSRISNLKFIYNNFCNITNGIIYYLSRVDEDVERPEQPVHGRHSPSFNDLTNPVLKLLSHANRMVITNLYYNIRVTR